MSSSSLLDKLCRRNSAKFLAFRRILDRNETSTTFPRIFEACIVLNGSNFRLSNGDKFLDGVNATRNFERKFVLCGEFSGRKFVVLFILLKKIWLNLWLVTILCNTPIKFPATIPVSARPILFTLGILIVSMRLGSFMYSTFDSNHGKSFKLF